MSAGPRGDVGVVRRFRLGQRAPPEGAGRLSQRTAPAAAWRRRAAAGGSSQQQQPAAAATVGAAAAPAAALAGGESGGAPPPPAAAAARRSHLPPILPPRATAAARSQPHENAKLHAPRCRRKSHAPIAGTNQLHHRLAAELLPPRTRGFGLSVGHPPTTTCPADEDRRSEVILLSALPLYRALLPRSTSFSMALPVTGRWMVGASKMDVRGKYMRAAKEARIPETASCGSPGPMGPKLAAFGGTCCGPAVPPWCQAVAVLFAVMRERAVWDRARGATRFQTSLGELEIHFRIASQLRGEKPAKRAALSWVPLPHRISHFWECLVALAQSERTSASARSSRTRPSCAS